MRVNPAIITSPRAVLLKVYFDVTTIVLPPANGAFESEIVWADPADHNKTFDLKPLHYDAAMMRLPGADSFITSSGGISAVAGSGGGGSGDFYLEFVDENGDMFARGSILSPGYNSPLDSGDINAGASGSLTEKNANGIRITGHTDIVSTSGGILTLPTPLTILFVESQSEIVPP